MHAGARTGSITCPVRTVGGGKRSRVTAAPQRPPHMFPQCRIGPCTRYRSASAPSASPAAERSVTGVVTTSPASARTDARRSRQRHRARSASSRSRNRHGRTSAAKPSSAERCRREERAAASAASPVAKRRARTSCTGIVPTVEELQSRRRNFRAHPDRRRRHRAHHRRGREARHHRRQRDSPPPTPAVGLLHSLVPGKGGGAAPPGRRRGSRYVAVRLP